MTSYSLLSTQDLDTPSSSTSRVPPSTENDNVDAFPEQLPYSPLSRALPTSSRSFHQASNLKNCQNHRSLDTTFQHGSHMSPPSSPFAIPIFPNNALNFPCERENGHINTSPHRSLASSSCSSPLSLSRTSPSYRLIQRKVNSSWSKLYSICLTGIFASYLLVYLQTDVPTSKHPIGDTIYTVLRKSYPLLATDTILSLAVGLVWMTLLCSFVRSVVQFIALAVPIALTTLFIYSLFISFRFDYPDQTVQDIALRFFSFIPLTAAIIWTFALYRSRYCISRSVKLIEFSISILSHYPHLILLGFFTALTVAGWTWIWLFMFVRIFLAGHFETSHNTFHLYLSSVWVAIYFLFMYLWTQGVLSGIQRATSAAAVSHWYFHQSSLRSTSSARVVFTGFSHSVDRIFGSIVLSKFLRLCGRFPLMILPRRFTEYLLLLAYAVVPTSLVTLTHPLTLTYAAIHSVGLCESARRIVELNLFFPYTPDWRYVGPGRRMGNRVWQTLNANWGVGISTETDRFSVNTSYIVPFRLAKLVLHGVRYMAALSIGTGAWIRFVVGQNDSASTKSSGSLYAYIVGLVAAALGWGIFGAMQGIFEGVLDAVLICWASEGCVQRDEFRFSYCRELNELLNRWQIEDDQAV